MNGDHPEGFGEQREVRAVVARTFALHRYRTKLPTSLTTPGGSKGEYTARVESAAREHSYAPGRTDCTPNRGVELIA
jgi:hypothetical protein